MGPFFNFVFVVGLFFLFFFPLPFRDLAFGLLYSDFFSNLPIGYQVSDVGLGLICD